MKNVEDIYPLAPTQAGILFHALAAPREGLYHEQHCCLLLGALDRAALRAAWQDVVDRHPVLRTAFLWEGLEEPLQAVRRRVRLPWLALDWSSLPPARRAGQLAALLAADRERGFDLQRAPLLRLTLAREEEERHRLIASFHHLILDGWSLPGVLAEVLAAYEAATGGRPAAWPRRRPYRDFIAFLGGQDPARAEPFWREALAGFTEPTPLPADRGPAAGSGPDGHGAAELRLPEDLGAALAASARRLRLPPFTLLAAAWAVLLARAGGRDDVVFGVTYSGRPEELAGSERMIGLFINTLPVRLRPAPELRAADFLATVAREQVALRAWEHTPLVRVRGWSEVPAELPLFESLLVYESAPRAAGLAGAARGGLRVAEVQLEERTNYPLTLLALPDGETLVLRALFTRRRLGATAVRRLLAHLGRLLAGLCGEAGVAARLGDLPLLSEAERHQLVVESNDTTGPPPDDLLTLLAGTPGAPRERRAGEPALLWEGGAMSHGELWRAAGDLAARLAAAGACAGEPVAIHLARGPALAVAVLAVLYAGAACLPVDPALPPARRALLLAQGLPRVVVTAPGTTIAMIAARAGTRIVHFALAAPEDAASSVAVPGPAPVRDTPAGALAYVLYTSGSTGRPKGVALGRAALANLVAWQAALSAGLPRGARTLQLAPIGFDVAFQEILATWAGGGALVLVDEPTRRDPDALWDFLDRFGIARLFLPFVALRELAAAAARRAALPGALRQVITAGEPLHAAGAVAALFDRLGPGCRLINQYGPTETHVVTSWTLPAEPRGWEALPPIGRPVTQARLHVLDAWGGPQPLASAGELCLGGPQLARGYFGDPAATAERFIPDPFARTPGERLYRSGDLARRREGGELEFLGRGDQQVKVRGVRVEPGEVEAALAAHPAVRAAAVVAAPAGPGAELRLAAFAVPAGEPADPAELRRHLAELLPAALVPEMILPLAALPLTPTGKLDRRALGRLAEQRAAKETEAAGGPPRDAIEELVAATWAEVLELAASPGRDDDFFALGGHSLHALRVRERLRAALGCELPVAALFEEPTLSGLARRITSLRGAPPGTAVPPLAAVPRGRPGEDAGLPLSCTQERLWFLHQLAPASSAYNLPLAVELAGPLAPAALGAALAAVVARHEILRTTFAASPEGPVQLVAPPEPEMALPLVDLSSLPAGRADHAARTLVQAAAARPFDLARGPLLRPLLLRLAAERHVGVVALHHILADLWSAGVLLAELQELYAAATSARRATLPPLPLQYGDYAVWQRRCLAGPALAAEIDAWRRRLAGAPATSALPADRPRPESPSRRGDRRRGGLPAEAMAALAALARRETATPFMVLLAAWGALLGRLGGETDLVLGTPVANRSRREIEGLIGCFVNTLALRLDLSGDPPFHELVARVRQVVLDAFAAQELPFERLVEELRPPRVPGRNPLFQVMFALDNAPLPRLAIGALALRPFELAPQAVQFDLTLELTPGASGDLAALLDHATDLLDAPTAERLLAGFVALAAGAARAPALPLSALPLLDRAERDQLLRDWHRTARQVEVGGRQVDLEAVEAALLTLAGVRQAAVVRRGSGAAAHLVAYLAAAPGYGVQPVLLRAALAAALPEPALPGRFLVMPELPRAAGGEVDRHALTRLDEERAAAAAAVSTAPVGAAAAPRGEVERRIAAIWCEALGLPRVGRDESFFDLGGHSLLLPRVHRPICAALGRELPLVDLFRYPTVRALAELAGGAEAAPAAPAPPAPVAAPALAAAPAAAAADFGAAIAIVGLACRYPGAPDAATLWSNLCAGVESVRRFSDDELLAAGTPQALLADPQLVKAAAVLDDVAGFDARFFGYTPREAEIIDPQQRLMLECAWEALEDAGIDPARAGRRIGVYAGQGGAFYMIHNLLQSPLARDPAAGLELGLGNEASFLPTRVSYRLGLTGPSVNVQSACSTSLVAVHLAVQALLAGDCEAALAGGVTVLLPQVAGYLAAPGGVQSPDGHCRAFDRAGRGFVPGSGAGVVVLKPLARALADGDRVRAVIRGTGVANDGADRLGFTAPSVAGQAAAIAAALAMAGVEPRSIGHVEAHGTATALGDPIEVAALSEVFRARTAERGFCALGSIKTNIGHTDTAAGVAGLIKTVLMLEHGMLVPSLHFAEPNPAIDFAASPFYVATRTRPWRREGAPRRGGVSSFGLGGTNAHVVVEEAPALPPAPRAARRFHLLPLAARGQAALEAASGRLSAHLAEHPELPLPDVARTLQRGRRRFVHRRVLAASDSAEAARLLAASDPERVATAEEERTGRPVVFLFPGGGAQHAGMAHGLYEEEPLFRRELDRSAEWLAEEEGWDLTATLFAASPEAADTLRRTGRGLPALFAVEHALAQLLLAWGVRPACMIGHSLGEYTAACLAGVFTLPEALALVALRGRLFERLPAGAMLSAARPEEELLALLAPLAGGLSVAAVNGPAETVLSGSEELLGAVAELLERHGVEHRRIPIEVAAHSHLVAPILGELAAFVATLSLRPPAIPFLSNVSGDWIRAEEATDPDYWVRHLRQTVRFGDGLARLLTDPDRVFLEVGPGHALSRLVRQHPGRARGQAVAAAMRHRDDPRPDGLCLMQALGELWLAGADLDWGALGAAAPGRTVSLPTYPFERRRHWIEPDRRAPWAAEPVVAAAGPAAAVAGPTVAAGAEGPLPRLPAERWLNVPAWRPAPLAPATGRTAPLSVLLVGEGDGLTVELAARLRARGHRVAIAAAGPRCARLDDESFTVAPGATESYRELFAALGGPPQRVAHLLAAAPAAGLGDLDGELAGGFLALAALARALSGAPHPVSLLVLATGTLAAGGGEPPVPARAALLGAVRVIPQEMPHLSCRLLDFEAAEAGGWRWSWLLDQLAAEVERGGGAAAFGNAPGNAGDEVVAYRGGERLLLVHLPLAETPTNVLPPLRAGGAYLVTGGLGRLGLRIAEHLARRSRARLLLTGRTPLPPSGIAALRAIEEAGGRVEARTADAADPEAMDAVMQWIDDTWGGLDGVIHAAGCSTPEGAALLADLDPATAELHWRPKLRALPVLERCLRGRRPDFVLLCSSLAATLGGLGLAAYAGANAALEAFVAQHNRRSPQRWTAVAWETWDTGGLPPAGGFGASLAALALRPEEGLAVLERVLALGPLDRVLVSVAELDRRRARWAAPGEQGLALATAPAPPPAAAAAETAPGEAGEVPEAAPPAAEHPRAELRTPYVAPRTPLEAEVAALWAELFGVAEVGVHDNFFEMGGHSLLAVQLLNRLHRRYAVELPVRSLFEDPTVARFAARIALLQSAPAADGADGTDAAEPPPRALAAEIQAAPASGRRPLVERYLRQRLAAALGVAPPDLPADELPAGAAAEQTATDLIMHLRRDLGLQFYPREILACRSLAGLTGLVEEALAEAPPPGEEAPATAFGEALPATASGEVPPGEDEPGAASGEEAPAAVPRPAKAAASPAARNPRAVFLLSGPRCGSTLTRVMLAGHSRLFAPPELELLQHRDMTAWAAAVHEVPTKAMGLNRALMELERLTEEQARRRIHALVERGASVAEVYRLLQEGAGGRLLVDKSPVYALVPGALARAEETFTAPLYIHLTRHPHAAIASFIRNRLHRQFAPEREPQEVAEEVWRRANAGIRAFLAGIEEGRRCAVRFEELTADPEAVMRRLCDFLGVPFERALLDPYGGGRMIDGSGDPGIYDFQRIEPGRGEAWQRVRLRRPVHAETRRLAAELGYTLPAAPPSREAPRRVPPSFAQQRLWFLDRLHPGSSAYNLPLNVRAEGALSPRTLRAALAEVVRRHEVLRTTFADERGEPWGWIQPPAAPPLPLVELAALAGPRAERELGRLARAEADRPFDLRHGPLLRATLVQKGPGEHACLLTLHHIATDGWSNRLLLGELAALYDAFAAGRPSPLAELPLQYAEHARRQHSLLADGRLEGDLAFWRDLLAAAPETVELPFDHPRPEIPSTRAVRQAAALPPALAAAVAAAARRAGASLFMTLLAAFACLLRRLADQDDLVIGTPIAERARQELEPMIGLLVNTLPLRVQLPSAMGFDALVGRVRETALAAYGHQEIPFERLVEELQPARSLAWNPLFQVSFSLIHARPAALAAGGLVLEALPVAADNIKFDLSLAVEERAGGALGCLWEASRDLFAPPTLARCQLQLECLLEAALAAPEIPITELPLLGPVERQQVREWSGAGAPAGAPALLHAACERQAACAPHSLALLAGGRRLSYAELEERANRLAWRLRAAGVGPERLVGIHLPRGVLAVTAMLATLKAGGAYLALDPAYPPERLAVMLDDARPVVVLTTEALRPGVPAAGAAACLVLDEHGEPQPAVPGLPPGSAPAAPPPCLAVPHNAAVVFYTSGSGGRPKGTLFTHRSAAWYMAAAAARFALAPKDRMLHFCSISFDTSCEEIFAALSAGAALVVASEPARSSVVRLLAECRAAAVSVASLPTPFWHEMALEIAAHPDALPPSLRLVCIGGDKVAAERVADWRRTAGRVELLNSYGPTETTIAVTAFDATAEAAAPGAEVPLGRPLPGAEIYVADAAGGALAAGVPGDLWIGGAALTRGYLGRPDLTAERFVPHPFGARGARLYRSGDRMRFQADGVLAFVGRRDRQVKVRGHRVELTEVEAALGQHPAVGAAAVLVHTDAESAAQPGWAAGGSSLVAFVVPRQEPRVPDGDLAGELRAFLGRRLPAYMVPTTYVPLAALPLNANNKLDRRALARLARAVPGGEVRPVAAPEDELERGLVELWKEILQREEVGVEDNFFDLGGHSLSLVRLESRLREMLGRELPLLDLFRHPTVRGLARHLVHTSSPRPPADEAGAGGAPQAEPGAPALPPPRPVAAPPPDEDALAAAVAVVGMAGRFPGASGIEPLWANLRAGVESVVRLDAADLVAAGVPPEIRGDPRHVAAHGVLDGIELFDAEFFAIPPREAELLDPQHRLFLECAWEALEHAGYDPARATAAGLRIGVFAGASVNTYLINNLASHPALLQTLGNFQLGLHSERDFLPTRVSYKLGLIGPSLAVQTACSSSLVAVHLACRSLLAGECDLALAGGVSVGAQQRAGYLFQPGGILSPDGHCRAFDAAARGTVGGSGAAVVVLARLGDALAQGATLRAVVRGSAINNDGGGKAGFTAPGAAGQARAIAAALGAAGVDPATIGMVEAHGTGTELGDPVEVAALAEGFAAAAATHNGAGSAGSGGAPAGCALGSIKTNIGHLDAASGIAGLVKAALAVERGEIPPSLHFEVPNPRIDFASTPFYVNTRLLPWAPGGDGRDGNPPRRAGVSSFGIGGTNAHVVVEQPPSAPPADPGRPYQLLLLSARSEGALAQVGERLAERLAAPGAPALADAAHTLHVGRRAFAWRRALVAADHGEAVAALRGEGDAPAAAHEHRGTPPKLAFLFPGQGAQHPGMAQGVYEAEPAFRAPLDRCAALLAPHLGLDLRGLLLAPAGGTEEDAALDVQLARTELAQPALFTVEYALARWWMERCGTPWAMLGHSVGEWVAACLAGVFTLEDALELVAERGRLLGGLPPGAMLAVALPAARLAERLAGGLALAADNGPAHSVASGPRDEIERLAEELAGEGVRCRRLRTSHAFHSPAVEPVLAAFAARVARVGRAAPRLPWVSGVTGRWILAAEATAPDYWARQLRAPVRFAQGLATLLAEAPGCALVEVGPGRTLAGFARQHPARPYALSSLPQPREGRPPAAWLLETAGRLWTRGIELNPEALYAGERRRRVELPAYPFERRRYWIEPARGAGADEPRAAAAGAAGPETAAERAAGSEVKAERFHDGAHPRPALSTLFVAPRSEREARIATLWQELLRIDAVGVHDSFFELGGDSLLAPQVLLQLRQAFGVEVPLARLFEQSTVALLARAVEELETAPAPAQGAASIAAPGAAPDWAAEVALDPAIGPAGELAGDLLHPAAVLLTGATGFLGAFLLRDLLEQTPARVCCLVRATSPEAGRAKILANLAAYRLEIPAGAAARIVPVLGDLAARRWGLAEPAFQALAAEVEAVYHAGAWVNFTYPYAALKPANVGGTEEALRLAATGRGKPLHFISSIAVFAPDALAGGVGWEDADLPSPAGLPDGYPQSKWVAERLVRLARERGVRATVHRPGLIAGDSRTGIGNPKDLLWAFLKGCLQMGAAPDLPFGFDPVPVDFVSRAIVHLSRQRESLDLAFHYVHPEPLSWRQVFDFALSLGYPVRRLAPDDWARLLVAELDRSSANALFPFRSLFGAPPAAAPGPPAAPAGLPASHRFDLSHTLAGLAGSPLRFPALDEAQLGVYFAHFVASGFLPPPRIEVAERIAPIAPPVA